VQEANKRIEEQIESLRKRQRLWAARRDEDIAKLEQAIRDLEHINIDAEVQAHRDLEAFHVKKKALDDATRYIRQIDADDAKLNKILDKLRTEIAALDAHQCHSCGQDLHDDKQDELKQAKQALVQETALQLLANHTQRTEHEDTIAQMGVLGAAPKVFYDCLEDALNHRNSVETLRKDLATRSTDADPYEEQIADMQGQALQTVSYDALNELIRLQDHQDFLLKLLTSKDSFVRKKIIDQNLSYLNARLTHYLDRIGLPHTVVFQNDLTVSIEELGRELDFDNLSRGERTRLILSMSWAFRDVWESLYHPINLLFIDELMDNGLDSQGVENGLGLLKKMSRERHKSIWLVSHKDELAGRVENILKVVKENGFTTYNTDVEIA
jgi:DNA repair exonuclease SbcCD ATPase subunit